MSRRHLLGLVVILTVAGLGLFAYKYWVLGLPLAAGAELDVWTVEARVSYRAASGPAKATLQIPHKMPGFALLDENFVSRGYGLSTYTRRDGREAVWAVRRARGDQTLYYRATVYRDPGSTGDERAPAFPEVPELGEPWDSALAELVAEVRRQSADVATFTSEMLRRINDPSPEENVELFLRGGREPADRARIAPTLLAGARVPARVAYGVQLHEQTSRAPVEPWLEVHNGREWLHFNPLTGEPGLPENFLVWWRGQVPLIQLSGGSNAVVTMAVQRSVVEALRVAERRAEIRDSRALQFSLFSLPLRTQAVYSVLLLIPVGAFVMVMMRNLVGVRTFGTFMPILIALAFRETHLLWGVVLFTLIVALGLGIRFYLEKLRLLLVPRLTSVLIVVVLLMVVVSVVSHRLGLETGLSVALFPMVILTMVIERMSIVWEERGPGEAIVEGIGSLAVAALAYSAMSIAVVEYLVFAFPELLLLVLALTLLVGRYQGYRLFELVRFQAFLRGAS